MSHKEKNHRKYPHVHRERFYNYEGEKKANFLFSSLYMMLKANIQSLGKQHAILNWIDKKDPIAHSIKLQITWIGHSTFLIQIGGINILTDPIFTDLTPLFRRASPPGIPIELLPSIDFVVISHNHRDHMDAYTLKRLKEHVGITFLVPKGDKAWFQARNFERVIEHMWWDKQTFTASFDRLTQIEFMFLPALHWSQRGAFDYNRSLWGSWMIRCNDITMYFAGDTAYSPHFKDIAREFSSIDLAFMPIGPCEPRSWMKHSHIDAKEAVQGFIDLQANYFVPMHWGTYHLGMDNMLMPLDLLTDCWKERKLDSKQLYMPKIGQRLSLHEEIVAARRFEKSIITELQL